MVYSCLRFNVTGGRFNFSLLKFTSSTIDWSLIALRSRQRAVLTRFLDARLASCWMVALDFAIVTERDACNGLFVRQVF